MNPPENLYPIQIWRKSKHSEDEQICQIDDHYVLKTHPSFMLSNEKPKNIPKSDTLIQHAARDPYNSQKDSKTKRNFLKHQLQQKANPVHESFIDQSQTQANLHEQLSKLTKHNKLFKQQNTKLKNYVRFLQDYNLRLKNQLMKSIRRRNLDQSLELDYHQEQSQRQQSQIKQFSSSKLFAQNSQHQHFKNIGPLQHLAPKSIFTNQRLASSEPYRNISFGLAPNQSFDQTNYLSAFYENSSKPLISGQHYFNHQQNSKIYPSSFQPSFSNLSSSVNPETSQTFKNIPKTGNPENFQNSKNLPKSCQCLNNSLPIILNAQTPISQDQHIYQSHENTSKKIQNNKTTKKVVCTKCFQSLEINQNSSKITKKSGKNKQKNKHTEQLNCSTKQRCSSCNKIKSSKRSNASKSTIPTKQKQSTNIYRSNELSEKLNSLHQNRAKMQNVKEKIHISEFKY